MACLWSMCRLDGCANKSATDVDGNDADLTSGSYLIRITTCIK